MRYKHLASHGHKSLENCVVEIVKNVFYTVFVLFSFVTGEFAFISLIYQKLYYTDHFHMYF